MTAATKGIASRGADLHVVELHAMGCPCKLHLYGSNARRAGDASVAEIARLERKYSRYRDESVVSRINAAAGGARGVDVDAETAGLLDYAATCHEQSGGRFDITSGVLRGAWDFRSGRLPARAQVDALLPLVGWHMATWRRPRLVLPVAGMEIDLGGLVKEYAADAAARVCTESGVDAGLVDLGGDLRVIGPHPDGGPWSVGVRDPRRPQQPIASIELASGALASSGDYERCMVVDGRRYCHVLDPRSGWPVSGPASVSVQAEHCLIAGTATTVAMLLGVEAGTQWLKALGLPHLVVDPCGIIHGASAGYVRNPTYGEP